MEEETPTTAGPGPGRKHDDGVDSEDPVSTGNGISSLQQPLLKRSNTLTANHLAMVGAKVSHIESLDYEIIENDLFKHDWRSRSTVEVLQYVFLKWALAFLVGLLTGVIASLINLAIENISGIKMLHMVQLVREKRYWAGFFYFSGFNLALMSGSMRMTVSLCVIFLELTNNLTLLPMTMFVLLIAKTVGDAFNPSIYEIILDLKGLPFLEPKPEPWMKDLTVGELAAAKPRTISLQVIEKVSNVLEVLRSTGHNGFPVVDRPRPGLSELHGLVLRSHLVAVLRKRWFLAEKRRTEEWEARERFSSVELADKNCKIDDIELTPEELEMYIDLHPFTNTTPYTVVETMSVAKAVVLFRSVALRHMLIMPKYQGPEISPIVGILTRQDLRAHNILGAFPHLANKSKTH